MNKYFKIFYFRPPKALIYYEKDRTAAHCQSLRKHNTSLLSFTSPEPRLIVKQFKNAAVLINPEFKYRFLNERLRRRKNYVEKD